MSKELTEKWKKRELALGSYYVKDASGRVFIDEYIKIVYGDDVEPTVFRYEEVIVEVVARVPSHYQFVELTEKVKKVDELEKEKAELLEKIEVLKDESLYWEKSSLGVL